MNESIILVNEQDDPIGSKDRELVSYGDIYRVSSLWLTDAKSGKCLLAQRKWTKRNSPGKWGAAVSGTVSADETYEINIRREMAEELGLWNIELKPGPKQYIDDDEHRLFCQWFVGQVDENETHLHYQEEEVETIKWIRVKDLLIDVHDNPDRYTPMAEESFRLLGLA